MGISRFYWVERIIALIISLSYIILILTLLPRAYMVNDDVALLSFFRINANAPFISPILSHLLGWLYTKISLDIPWYGLFLYSVLLIALVSLLEWIFKLGFSLEYRLFLSITFLGLFSIFISQLTFTCASILLASIAIIRILDYLYHHNDHKFNPLEPIWWGLLLAIAYMTRLDGVKAVILFLTPILFYTGYRLIKNPIQHYLKPLIIFILPLLITILIGTIFNSSLSGIDRNYALYNQIRGAIHGFDAYNQIEKNQQLKQTNNWTKNDAQIFRDFMFFDEDKFSQAKIENVLKLGKVDHKIDYNLVLISTLNNWWNSRITSLGFIALLVLAWVLIKPSAKFFILSLGITIFILTFYMSGFLRFPERVALPIFYALSIAILFLTHLDYQPQSNNLSSRLLKLYSQIIPQLNIALAFRLLLFLVGLNFWLRIPKILFRVNKLGELLLWASPDYIITIILHLLISAGIFFYLIFPKTSQQLIQQKPPSFPELTYYHKAIATSIWHLLSPLSQIKNHLTWFTKPDQSLATLLVIILLIISQNGYYEQIIKQFKWQELYKQDINLIENKPDITFIIFPLLPSLQAADPLSPLDPVPHNVIFAGGWPTFSPPFYQSLKQLGINQGRQILPKAMNNPHLRLMTHNITALEILAEETYNLKTVGSIRRGELPSDGMPYFGIFSPKPPKLEIDWIDGFYHQLETDSQNKKWRSSTKYSLFRLRNDGTQPITVNLKMSVATNKPNLSDLKIESNLFPTQIWKINSHPKRISLDFEVPSGYHLVKLIADSRTCIIKRETNQEHCFKVTNIDLDHSLNQTFK